MTEKRPGPAPGVPLIEVSIKRKLTVFVSYNKKMWKNVNDVIYVSALQLIISKNKSIPE